MAVAVKLISPEVLNVLARAQCEGQSLRLVGQMDRKLYVQTNDVLEAAGGKWNKKSKAHLFDSDAADAVESLVLTGQYTRARDVQTAFGYFETPEPVVKRMFAAVAVLPGAKFLEPSAGRGAIALHIIEQFRPRALTCYEIQESNIDKLDERICNWSSDLGDRENFPVLHEDFLAAKPPPDFNYVFMNPPLAKRADIRHIRHAFGFLKPGGSLVAIASASVKFRDDALASDFRAFVSANHGHIEDLPQGSFKESGTMVNTVIVTMDRAA